MYISRLSIKNFRTISLLDVALSGDVVIVGENRVGKSSLLLALRLLLDPSLPDSARELGLSDIWDGATIDGDVRVDISIEVRDFESDMDVLAALSDFRLGADPSTVRLNYSLRVRPDLGREPATDEDLEFICYGGEDERRRFGHDVRRRLPLDVLPALRDAEGDLGSWRRSPLRPLLEEAFRTVQASDLDAIGEGLGQVAEKILEFAEVDQLEGSIRALYTRMSGAKHDIHPVLGLAPTDTTKLNRALRLLVDEGARGLPEASLGSANLVFLTLKLLELEGLVKKNQRDHTILAIEEPEAHLHPHLQRSVYRHLFDSRAKDAPRDRTVILTTHSPHIASVAPLKSLLLLREQPGKGSTGRSSAALQLTPADHDDLARYLDVTRAEMLFARGVILVEGDAERFLVPYFATSLGHSLDEHGISVCSVAGTNFQPYAKFLTAMGIPFSVITDWDDVMGEGQPLGINRAIQLIWTIESGRSAGDPDKAVAELGPMDEYDAFAINCEAHGVHLSDSTLELDLHAMPGYRAVLYATLREGGFGAKRLAMIEGWEKGTLKFEGNQYLTMIEAMGKGRFAQRLATKLAGLEVPGYIQRGIDYVVKHA